MLAYNDEQINSVLDKSSEIMNRFPQEVATGLLEASYPGYFYCLFHEDLPEHRALVLAA